MIKRLLFGLASRRFTMPLLLPALLMLCCHTPLTAQTSDNAELQRMYDEDQRSRMAAAIDWNTLGRQDSLREMRVYELIREGRLGTGRDHYNAALIFQHGSDTLASAMAVQEMRKALDLDTSLNPWLLAAAIDRDLMRRDKPQLYGTQFIKEGPDGKWMRYAIDSARITDAERKRYGVETLAEQRIKERNMNLLPLSDYYTKSKSILKVGRLIRSAAPGGDSTYDVSEDGVNSFGYSLMAAGKMAEALRMLQLNTQLHPASYNAYDSYGECLLKAGRKREALQAYRKSLTLSSRNEHARKILAASE